MEDYTQEELKQISEAFLIVFNKEAGSYPDNYDQYICGWENKDKTFSYGTYDEGNEQVVIQGQALWNFPIRKMKKENIASLKDIKR